MFGDLIKKVKSKLPERFRGEDDDDEYEDEEYEDEEGEELEDDDEATEVEVDGEGAEIEELEDEEELGEDEELDTDDKTAEVSVSQLNEESDEDDEDDDEEDDEGDDEEDDDDAKKAKKKKLIQIGLVVVIIGLAASEFMPSGDDTAGGDSGQPQLSAKEKAAIEKMKKKREERKKKREEEAAKKKAEAEKPVEQPAVVEPEPAKTPEPIKEEPIAPAGETKTVTIENNLQLNDDKDEEEDLPTPSTLGEGGSKNPIDEDPELDKELKEIIDEENEKPAERNALLEGIEKVKKLEYVEPPNYETLGRGLVYNCAGKHWACVSREDFLSCNGNNQWAEQNKKKPECATVNVYSSYDDCKRIQLHNINTLKEPPCPQ